MRSYNPQDESDISEAKKLNAQEWQLQLLAKNPEYVHWGNYEDYMSNDDGWNGPLEMATLSDMFELDELNECVNFYFNVKRKNHECKACEGSGLNPETKRLSDSWYGYVGERWSDKLTEVEVLALAKAGRLWGLLDRIRYSEEKDSWVYPVDGEWATVEAPELPSPAAVNAYYKKGLGHDAINKWICVRARAEHQGVYGNCSHCEGNGVVYDEPFARVSLQLWILHPRKGVARGVYIQNIEESEVEAALNFLKNAAKRNADRFAKL